MYHESIVSELLDWIEHNLDQSLTLETIAAKSGYSKWHLQRLFKSYTGHTLGTYTRQRRLTMAATELRMSQNSVLRIADKYQFDSQQTFTRTFKKQFKTTPAVYRRLPEWPSYGLCPKIELDERVMAPPAEEVVAEAPLPIPPELEWVGLKTAINYPCKNSAWSNWKSCPQSAMSKSC
ncbi:helix-turn-helix domain-containing protein [Rahnella sp. SAP-1]|jgi:AraC family transcriptional activator of mar-sox-rob regulon|uniref:Helix-turn-helix domain-containing protein n=1 Tax=Rouxiella aceris TaxID=2703884 RepID=A0A848ML40_9GAMM|nr:helix-turn-helix domain-containing protein [Rouxiella aceris]NMP29258.1 helix-turn-helix domain-containing protein [Rouxiella aceris]